MDIKAVQVVTANLAAQRRFYTGVLGLSALPTDPDTLSLAIGTSRLTFTAGAADPASVYHVACDIPEHQFAEARDWLAARVPLVGDSAGRTIFHFAAWQAHAVYFIDPDGNLLELIARQTRPRATNVPFSAASLVSISEIGLVVNDVPAMVAHLRATLGLEPYHGSGPTFTAVGDDGGLLIVVERGRGWYPDRTMPAVPLPLTIELTDRVGTVRTLNGPPYEVRAQHPGQQGLHRPGGERTA